MYGAQGDRGRPRRITGRRWEMGIRESPHNAQSIHGCVQGMPRPARREPCFRTAC